MKKAFKYLGVLMAVALAGAFTACTPEEAYESADIGLGIKVFFPTKVVTGQPMTINGSGFSDVKEIIFPDGVSVTNFQIVSNDMIRVNAPSGIASQGGPIKVRTADDEAESRISLTIGSTVVSGFSKQDGEEIGGGEQLTIYGKDLEFISSVELLDTDGNPLVLQDEDFYRKGTSSVVITIPKKAIYDGTFVGYLHTIDGKVIPLPELKYTPASDGGYWQTVETVIWENDDPAGHGAVNWSGQYRFALEGTDGNNEAIVEIPADVWEKMKTTPFYMQYSAGDSYQIRVVTGWWNDNWPGPGENDIAPWNLADMIIPNDDGTFYIEVNLEGAAILQSMDAQHLLFTGSGYTPLKLYFKEEIWVDGGGHWETVKTPVWTNDDPEGNGVINWSGTYRFAGEGFSTGEEIYTIPADIWEKMKTTPFYMRYSAGDSYQIRVVTGWWNDNWPGPGENDIAPWNLADMIIPLDDGTFCIEVNLEGAAILQSMDAQHLLFTGSGYTPLEIYFQEEIWVGGGGDTPPQEVVIWENDGSAGSIAWSGTYRFAGEGFSTGEEIYTIPADTWGKMKTTPFYMKYRPDAESYQIRVVTGWWNDNWPGPGENDIAPWNLADMIIDNGDGTYHIEVNLEGAAILESMDAQHLLFTGNGYTVLKLYFLE